MALCQICYDLYIDGAGSSFVALKAYTIWNALFENMNTKEQSKIILKALERGRAYRGPLKLQSHP